jgi:hypothetical protein
VPVALVENRGHCNVNYIGEKILPNGTVWLISLLEWIVKVATSESSKSIFINTNLIDGPNVNQRGKLWIMLILLAQFLLNCLAHLQHHPEGFGRGEVAAASVGYQG